ncbi:MAG TPA: hypothetical protein VKN99_11080 [Polyangia bacterium]|nr:hypothetical protein [Polyangia bacterium]
MPRVKHLLAIAVALGCATFRDDTGWAPQPAGADADAKAQKAIDETWQAMGVLPTYKTYGEIRFTWNFTENGALKKSESFYWNRFEHRMRWESNTVEGDRIAVRVDLVKHTGKAFHAKRNVGGSAAGNQTQSGQGVQGTNNANLVQAAKFEPLPSSEFEHYQEPAVKSFVQARRWLIGPINLRDPGVHVKFETDVAGPDEKKYEALHVTFDASADVDRKGDELWWLLSPDTRLPSWMLWKQEGHEGKSAWALEEWKDVGGGLKLPTLYKQWGTQVVIQFANVQANPRPEDELYFESVH